MTSAINSWGFAPGWYGIAPSALKRRRIWALSAEGAPYISLGRSSRTEAGKKLRAESPTYKSFETDSALHHGLPHFRFARLNVWL
jgi:hypothetical protein